MSRSFCRRWRKLRASYNRPLPVKTRPISKKILDFLGKNDKAGLDKFTAPKLTKGDCLSLPKGMDVTIDTKDAKLFCVRPTGELDCYWTLDAGINQNPVKTEARPAAHSGGGHKHGGANSPPP